MKTIQATDDLVIELWPAGEAADRPVLRLRNLGDGSERNPAEAQPARWHCPHTQTQDG
jgi:hypothetical protein